MLNDVYRGLLGKTPAYLSEHKIFGTLLSAFTKGYSGQAEPYYLPMNSAGHVAYMAGKDTRDRRKG